MPICKDKTTRYIVSDTGRIMEMAKTIKFNLICDEKPVRTIEDAEQLLY